MSARAALAALLSAPALGACAAHGAACSADNRTPCVVDADGDGLGDDRDSCPTVPGMTPDGCPAPAAP